MESIPSGKGGTDLGPHGMESGPHAKVVTPVCGRGRKEGLRGKEGGEERHVVGDASQKVWALEGG